MTAMEAKVGLREQAKALALALHLGNEAFATMAAATAKHKKRVGRVTFVTLGPRLVEAILLELGPSAQLLLRFRLQDGHKSQVILLGRPPLPACDPQASVFNIKAQEAYAKDRLKALLGKPASALVWKAMAWVCREGWYRVDQARRKRKASAAEPSSQQCYTHSRLAVRYSSLQALANQAVTWSAGFAPRPVWDLSVPLARRLELRGAIAFLTATRRLGWRCHWESMPVLFGDPAGLTHSWEEWSGGRYGHYHTATNFKARISRDWLRLERARGEMIVKQAKGKHPWLLLGKDADGTWVGARQSLGNQIESGRLVFDAKGRASLEGAAAVQAA